MSINHDEIRYFYEDCIDRLNRQVFEFESDEAKKCAIQAVRYVLQDYLKRQDMGEKYVLDILKYDKPREYWHDISQSFKENYHNTKKII